jgi:hypothetical protein
MRNGYIVKHIAGIILLALYILPLSACSSETIVAKFSVPPITVKYQDIITKYPVAVRGGVSEQEVEELFAILQMIQNDTKYSESRYYVSLSVMSMTMTKQDNGNIEVWTNSNTGMTSSYGNRLVFKRARFNKWYLIEKAEWIS